MHNFSRGTLNCTKVYKLLYKKEMFAAMTIADVSILLQIKGELGYSMVGH